MISAGSAGLGGPLGPMPFMSASQTKAVIIISIIIQSLLFYSEWVMFSLYLRAVALTVKERWLAGGCMGLLGMACGVGGVNILLWILILSISNPIAVFWVGEIMGLIWFGLMLGFAIWYMRTILQLRYAVG
jgi:hypothetical protein